MEQNKLTTKSNAYILWKAAGSREIEVLNGQVLNNITLEDAILWFKDHFTIDEGMTITDENENLLYTFENLKLTVNNFEYLQSYIEISFVKNIYGPLTAYHDGRKIDGCKIARGCGYDKYGVMLSNVLNCITGMNLCENMGQGEDYTINDALNYGIKIERVCNVKNGKIYKFTNLNAKGA